MACYHPLHAFYRIREDGKKDIKFAEFKGQKFYSDLNGVSYPYSIEIPCGQCVGCRLEYSRQWATRCVLECLKSEHNYFLTLTYDDLHLPSTVYPFICSETGEVSDLVSHPLVPERLTKFLKDLRRYFEYHFNFTGIRFFACGEYGDKNLRPHFHLILFNCPIPDLEFFKNSFNGDIYWTSEIISKLWPEGFHIITNANYETCAYVSRYMLKKQKGKNADYYDKIGLIPPFVRSSRNPGIARTFYDENSDSIYEFDSLVITGKNGKAKKVRPPHYYDRLYDLDNPDDLVRIKEKRKMSALNNKQSILDRTSDDHDTFLAKQESLQNSKAAKLIRPI